MNIFLFFAILILGFFTAVTAAVKPDVIEQKYHEITAPIVKHLAERKAVAWQTAKDAERAAWMLKQSLPPDCATSKSAIRELECRNKVQLHAQAFEQEWAAKVSKGWKPDGIED